jgi:hypothetical protein
MIKRIIIRNYKSIQEIDLELGQFHLLVGANASGKSTFLDALQFVQDCLEFGAKKAVEKRTGTDFNDLTFMRRGGDIRAVCTGHAPLGSSWIGQGERARRRGTAGHTKAIGKWLLDWPLFGAGDRSRVGRVAVAQPGGDS